MLLLSLLMLDALLETPEEAKIFSCNVVQALFTGKLELPHIKNRHRVRCEMMRNISGVRGVFY